MTVYFWTPDVRHAAGGIRTAYRLVDACNHRGLDTAILHQRRGFRAEWFENRTRVVAAVDTPVRGNDVLVISELDAPHMLNAAPGITKVILNQHQYWTFNGGQINYLHPDVAAVVAVSADGIRYLRYAFPALKPFRLHCAVDSELFKPRKPRERKLVFLASKGAYSRGQVFPMLENRGAFAGWKLESLAGLTQEQLAELLGHAAILASFSEYEGFQMLLTEAMAAGCAVIGYTAGGGAEYLVEDYGWPVPTGDVVTFAKRLEGLMGAWASDQQTIVSKTDRAREYVRRQYTLEQEAADIIEALRPALARAQDCDPTASYNIARPDTWRRVVAQRTRLAAKALQRG